MGLKGGILIDADSGPLRLDAVVVFVTSQTLFFRLALAILGKFNYEYDNEKLFCQIKFIDSHFFRNMYVVLTIED